MFFVGILWIDDLNFDICGGKILNVDFGKEFLKVKVHYFSVFFKCVIERESEVMSERVWMVECGRNECVNKCGVE